MVTVKKFRGAILQRAKDGRLFARIPYRGVREVKAGDRIPTKLGPYTVTGKE